MLNSLMAKSVEIVFLAVRSDLGVVVGLLQFFLLLVKLGISLRDVDREMYALVVFVDRVDSGSCLFFEFCAGYLFAMTSTT